MQRPKHHTQNLARMEKPLSLISLQYTNKSENSLPDLARFKNLVFSIQTQLDLSGNVLRKPVPELFALKFLRQLSLADNQLDSLWALPNSIEHLNVSFNNLRDLQPVIGSLAHLTYLDVSHNQLERFPQLPGCLKSVYASQNQLTDAKGLESLRSLNELDVSHNRISDASSLLASASLCVIDLRENPAILQTSYELLALDSQLYYRSSHKELSSSKYKVDLKRFRERSFDEECNHRKLSLPLAQIDTGCMTDKQECEGWSTKPKTHAQGLLEELIAYCQISGHLDA